MGSTASAIGTSDDVVFDVSLRGTGTSTIHAHVFDNPSKRGVVNVLAVHGLVNTGFVYGPLAQAIFSDALLGGVVRRVLAIDLPGHGDSTFPENLPDGAKFGDLLIEDNAGVVLQSNRRPPAQGPADANRLRPQHGGARNPDRAAAAPLRAVEPRRARGRRRRPARTGPAARTALDRSPDGRPGAIPRDRPGAGHLRADSRRRVRPAGVHDDDGPIASNAPTPDEVTAGRYLGPEPISTLSELVEAAVPLPDGGSVTLQRPTIEQGAFAPQHGTVLSIVSFSEDTLVPAADLGPLYEYLTGDSRDRLYHEVTAPDAVHEMLVSDPTPIVRAIQPAF